MRIKAVVSITFPVFVGYLWLGCIFGVTLNRLGVDWHYSSIMATLIYSGSTQFFLIHSVNNSLGYTSLFFAALCMSLRHLAYGSTLVSENQKRYTFIFFYRAFALTDETYSLLSTVGEEVTKEERILISFINHFYWIMGCTLGAVLSKYVPQNIKGLDFSLSALFAVLLVSNSKKDSFLRYVGLSLLTIIVAINFAPKSFQFVSIIVIGIILYLLSEKIENGVE